MIDVSEEVQNAIWGSKEPYQSQMTLLSSLVVGLDQNNLQLVLAISGLAKRCRAEVEIRIAKDALQAHLNNPWALLRHAQLCDIQFDRNGVSAAYTAAIQQLTDANDLLDPVKVEWLRLLANHDSALFCEFGNNMQNSLKDAVLYDVKDGVGKSGDALSRYSDHLSKYADIDKLSADKIIKLSENVNYCANQHLEWHDATAVDVSWLRDVLIKIAVAKKTKRAFSIVRLGDGEALFLQGLRSTLAGAAGRLQGGGYRVLDNNESDLVKNDLESAIRNADLCLIPDLRQILFGPKDFWRVWSEVDRVRGFDSEVVGGAWSFGVSLEMHGLANELISLTTGIIGPVDPEKTRFLSGREINWIQIPGEVDRLDDSKNVESHFHNYYSLIKSMNFSPGEVWLVAGGILGKSYCNEIRSKGGIAVDIGSIMDVWSGRTDTRGEFRLNPWIVKPHLMNNS